MTDTTATIRSKIDAFITEIESLTRLAALEAVHAALTGSAPSATPRANGRRVARRAATTAMPKPAASPTGKRAKRTTEDVAAIGAKIVGFVRSNPGCSVEQIRDGLGLSKKDVALPIVRLKEERQLKTQGQKRGTKYFAGGAGPTAKSVAKQAAPTKKRKPMSPEQKAALLERLAKARAARATKKS